MDNFLYTSSIDLHASLPGSFVFLLFSDTLADSFNTSYVQMLLEV
jgi:hypothetical protein